MAQKFANNWHSTVAVQMLTTHSTLTVASGGGASLEAQTGTLSTTNYCLLTLARKSGSIETAWEIVRVTSVTGDILALDMIGSRNKEGSSLLQWEIGETVSARMTRDSILAAINSGSPAGTIVQYGGAAAPSGWLLCDASEVNRGTYADLFTAIGTTYGSAGPTTFTLPDLRSRIPLGAGAGPGLTTRTRGQKSGAENHALTIPEMASHNHGLGSHTHGIGDHTHSGGAATSAILCPGGGSWVTPNLSNTGSASGNTDAASGNTSSTGSGTAFDMMNPYTVVNYIIKT